MRVVSLINGSLTSQTASIYALHYVKTLELPFSIIHIKNTKDTLDDVNKSYKDIEEKALQFGLEIDLKLFENLLEFKTFINTHDIDMLFCSTKYHHSILDTSFSKSLIQMKLKADIAIVKVLKVYGAEIVENIILPIRDSKLSVKKFTLFSVFAKAYNAKSEIYSVDKISKSDAAWIDKIDKKKKLEEIIFSLRHYLRLAKIMNFKFSIKHDFAFIQGDLVKSHIVKQNHDLIIIGAHHKNTFFGSHPTDILFKDPIVNSIYFIPYKDEE